MMTQRERHSRSRAGAGRMTFRTDEEIALSRRMIGALRGLSDAEVSDVTQRVRAYFKIGLSAGSASVRALDEHACAEDGFWRQSVRSLEGLLR